MNTTRHLHALGQSLWLDNITRELLSNGDLARYIQDYNITGLTSNPTIFDKAIRSGNFYDEAIGQKTLAGLSGERLFFELALEDLTRAADLLLSAHKDSKGLDGWVSLEVSPELADDTEATIQAASALRQRAHRSNLMIKIPGNKAGLKAIEESIFAGVPVNSTLLFSTAHYQAVAEAYLRGLERRHEAGLDLKVGGVASLFISRWDAAIKGKTPGELQNRLGIAIAKQSYKAYCDILAGERWQKLAAAGAQPQRLLWASTGTKDPAAPDTLYIDELPARNTVTTIPENTLQAFAEHGKPANALTPDGGNHTEVLQQMADAGVDVDALAANLQEVGIDAFKKSWHSLLECLGEKSNALA